MCSETKIFLGCVLVLSMLVLKKIAAMTRYGEPCFDNCIKRKDGRGKDPSKYSCHKAEINYDNIILGNFSYKCLIDILKLKQVSLYYVYSIESYLIFSVQETLSIALHDAEKLSKDQNVLMNVKREGTIIIGVMLEITGTIVRVLLAQLGSRRCTMIAALKW